MAARKAKEAGARRPPPSPPSYGQQPVDEVFGDFRVMRAMSRGSLGTLHVAEDLASGALCLLRVMPSKVTGMAKVRQQIQEDLDRLASIDHRNVTRLIARGEHAGRLYYVMDFPSQVTLADLIRVSGPLAGIELLWLASGLAGGVEALHKVDLPHGNLWPAKVALTRLGPVIVDLSWTSRLKGGGAKPHQDLQALAATVVCAAKGVLPSGQGEIEGGSDLPGGVPEPVQRLLERLSGDPSSFPGVAEISVSLQAAAEDAKLGSGQGLEQLFQRIETLADEISRQRSSNLSDPNEESQRIPLPSMDPPSSAARPLSEGQRFASQPLPAERVTSGRHRRPGAASEHRNPAASERQSPAASQPSPAASARRQLLSPPPLGERERPRGGTVELETDEVLRPAEGADAVGTADQQELEAQESDQAPDSDARDARTMVQRASEAAPRQPPSDSPVTTRGRRPSDGPVTTRGRRPSDGPVTTRGRRPRPSTGPVTTQGPRRRPPAAGPATTAGSPSTGPVTTQGQRRKDSEEETVTTALELELRPGLMVRQERILGEGGMGVVHLVRDPLLGRLAALKLVRRGNPVRLRRFEREKRVTARLAHPSIPPVYEAGQTEAGEPYLLMRYVEGDSLADILARRKPEEADDESTRELLHALTRVGEAIAYAHSRRVVHRDLKPHNVMLGAFGEVFVMDWGLARDLEESLDQDARQLSELAEAYTSAALNQGLTQEGTVLGTPGYMPPEQARGEDVDLRADVFALGAVLCEILTGKPPFTGPTALAVLGLNRAGDVEYPSQRFRDVDPELDAIARRALAPQVEQRYPTIEDLVADLRAYLEGRPVSVYTYDTSEVIWRWLRLHPTFVTGVAVTLLAAVAAPLVVWRLQRSQLGDELARANLALAEDDLVAADDHFRNARALDPADDEVEALREVLAQRQKAKLAQQHLANARERARQAEAASDPSVRVRRLTEARYQLSLALGDLPEAKLELAAVEQQLAQVQTEIVAATVEERRAREREQLIEAGRAFYYEDPPQLEQARAAFARAAALGAEGATKLLRFVEQRLAAGEAQDKVTQGWSLLKPDAEVADLERAERLFIEALTIDGSNADAARLLVSVGERRAEIQARREAASERANRRELARAFLVRARGDVERADELINTGGSPVDVRAAYLDATANYSKYLLLVPADRVAQGELKTFAKRASDRLRREGQSELASYVLKSAGLDEEIGVQNGPADPFLSVSEASQVTIQQAFGARSDVRFRPSQAFGPLRRYLAALDRPFKAELEIHCSPTADKPPKILLREFRVRVTDKKTGVRGRVGIVTVDGSYPRTVQVTSTGRLVGPWEGAIGLDENFYGKQIFELVRELIAERR